MSPRRHGSPSEMMSRDGQPAMVKDATGIASTSPDFAGLLADFVDVLIPADDRWPAASRVGVQAVLSNRLLDVHGAGAVDRLVAILLAAGAPFAGKTPIERTAIVAEFERREVDLFGLVRNAVYLAYYESAAVLPIIESLGYSYKLRPHVEGYRMPPVDQERDRPQHHLGFYVPTTGVQRVDMHELDHLGLN